MQKCLISLLIFSLFFCKEKNSDYYNIIINKEKKEDTIITNIVKLCNESLVSNIYDYYLCKNWKVLSEKQIKDILKNSKLQQNPEILHDIEPATSIWINADISIKDIHFKMKINGMSYFYLIDSFGNRELYDLKNRWELRKYFVRIISEEDDNLYEQTLLSIKNRSKSIKTDLNQWKGHYFFEINQQKYTVNINDSICMIYPNAIPACEIQCVPLLTQSKLILYFDADNTNLSACNSSLIERSCDGDYLFSLSKINEKYWIQSPYFSAGRLEQVSKKD